MARGKSKTSAKERVCSEEFIVEDEAQSDVAPSDEYIELDSSDDGETINDESEQCSDVDEEYIEESDNPFIVTPSKVNSTKVTRSTRVPAPPPPTPTPKKETRRGVKRSVTIEGESESDVFIPSPTRDSPKKPRTNASTQRGASTPRGNRASAPMTPTTPTPVKKSRVNASRQKVFQDAVKKVSVSTTPSKKSSAVSNLTTPSKKSACIPKTPVTAPIGSKPSQAKSPSKSVSIASPAPTPGKQALKPKVSTAASKRVRVPKKEEPRADEVTDDEVPDDEIVIKPLKLKSPSKNVTSGRKKVKPAVEEQPEDDDEEQEERDEVEEVEDIENCSEISGESEGAEDEEAEDEKAEETEEIDSKGKKILNSKTTYLEDLDPVLSGRKIVSWKTSNLSSDEGFYFFSTVVDWFKGVDIKYLKSIVCFAGDKEHNVTNLSRIDPTLLCAKRPTPMFNRDFICFRGTSVPARCLIAGFVVDDKTTESFGTASGKVMKALSLVPLSLEAERNFTATSMLFGVESYTSDILENVLSLVTRMEAPSSSSAATTSDSKGRKPRLAGRSKSVGTPNKAISSTVSTLGPQDDIPIFDGRNLKIDLPEDLKTLNEKLPRFQGIVPKDSFVLACYTVGSYYNGKKEFKIANNILWAVVLCGDDPKK